MKIIQKFMALILLFIFTSVSVGNAGVYNDENVAPEIEVVSIKINPYLEQAKNDVLKLKNGDKLVKKIDIFLEKIKNDDEKLNNLVSKLNNLETKFYEKNNYKKYKKYFVLINYIIEKILYIQDKKRLAKLKLEEEKAKKALEEIENSKISEVDKKKAEVEILNFQKLLLDGNNPFIGAINKASSYEEKGNFKLKYNFDLAGEGKMNSNFELENYISKKSGADSSITGKLKVLFSATDKRKGETKIEFDSLIDFISKDGDLYLGLKKLNIINDGNEEEIKQFFTKMKDFLKKDKYVKIDNKQNTGYSYDLQSIIKQQIKTIRNSNPTVILDGAKDVLSKTLFKAYKKEGNKYYLIPTKYSCDKYMETMHNISIWFPGKCSDSDYEKVKKEILKMGEIYLETGKENKIGYKAFDKKSEKFEIYSNFNKNSINKIYSNFITNKTDGFKFEYIKNKKIDFSVKDRDYTKLDFKSTLNSKNIFNTIDFNYTQINSYNKDRITAKFNLKNKKFSGTFKNNYNSYAGYDNETYKSKYEKNLFDGRISGSIDSKNNISSLDIALNNKNLDKNTESFKTSIVLNNKKIFGETTIFNKDGKKYISVKTSGKYEENYLELNNKIDFEESPYKSIFNSFAGNVRMAKNAKVISDIANLSMKIDMKNLEGNYLEDFVGKNDTINFEKLEEKEKNYKQSNGDSYKYKVKKMSDGNYTFQIMGYTIDENGNKIANIRGSYYQETEESTESLFMYNGKYITNGDIIGKDVNFKKVIEKKPVIEANADLKIDSRNNKNNFNLKVNYSEDNKKILDIEVDNQSTRTYKNVEIKAPENTVDFNEAMGIEKRNNDYLY